MGVKFISVATTVNISVFAHYKTLNSISSQSDEEDSVETTFFLIDDTEWSFLVELVLSHRASV